MRYDSITGAREDYVPEPKTLTLGCLIDKLFQFDGNLKVFFIGTCIPPTKIMSYGGNWQELSINYDYQIPYGEFKEITVKDFHCMLVNALGKWNKGYFGGEYLANVDSKLWAARDSRERSNLAIIDVVESENVVYLVTLKKEIVL